MHDGSSTVLTINDPNSLDSDAGVTSVVISPDGRWVAAGSLDAVVRIWEVATGKLVERLRGHRASVYSVAFTPDGRGLVSGSLDKTVKYWDVSELSVGGSGGGTGGVKSKEEGAVVAAAAASSAESSVGRKDEKPRQYTMNFLGHKVRCFSFLPPFLSL
jgi:glucose repression regulatory protein TUP1